MRYSKYVLIVAAVCLGVFLGPGLSSSVSAAPQHVDDFETEIPQLDGSGWTWSNINSSSTDHTADATSQSGRIEAGKTAALSLSTKDLTRGDWAAFAGYYLGLYVWGSGDSRDKFNICIIEEDYYATEEAYHDPVKAVWKLAEEETLDWTGWRYKMYQLPAFDTEFKSEAEWDYDFIPDYSHPENDSNADKRWNPECALSRGDPDGEEGNYRPDLQGVIKIEFVNNGDSYIYIDEITISGVNNTEGWVKEIFPANDTETVEVDAVLGRLPPTISAVLGPEAGVDQSRLYIIEEDPAADPGAGYPTDSLVDPDKDKVAFEVNSRGIFIAPNDTPSDSPDGDGDNDGEYIVNSGQTKVFTVFVRPADSEGDFGQAEVVTFRVLPPAASDTRKTRSSYTRERIY